MQSPTIQDTPRTPSPSHVYTRSGDPVPRPSQEFRDSLQPDLQDLLVDIIDFFVVELEFSANDRTPHRWFSLLRTLETQVANDTLADTLALAIELNDRRQCLQELCSRALVFDVPQTQTPFPTPSHYLNKPYRRIPATPATPIQLSLSRPPQDTVQDFTHSASKTFKTFTANPTADFRPAFLAHTAQMQAPRPSWPTWSHNPFVSHTRRQSMFDAPHSSHPRPTVLETLGTLGSPFRTPTTKTPVPMSPPSSPQPPEHDSAPETDNNSESSEDSPELEYVDVPTDLEPQPQHNTPRPDNPRPDTPRQNDPPTELKPLPHAPRVNAFKQLPDYLATQQAQQNQAPQNAANAFALPPANPAVQQTIHNHHNHYYAPPVAPAAPAAALPANQTPEMIHITKEAKIEIRKPDPFTGKDRSKWKPFFTETLMNFKAKPFTYSSEHSKVAFAASYLKDTALNHYTTLLQYDPGHPALHSWNNFATKFGQRFGVANTQIEADNALNTLMMSERAHFNTFIIRFEEYGYDSGWNDAALRSSLYQCLPKRIKDVMKFIPRPPTYLSLRDLVMQIDQRFWEDEAENR